MKKTAHSTKTNPEKTKADVKLKDLKPKRNPKGGRTGGCDEWGCGTNHNETFVCDSSR